MIHIQYKLGYVLEIIHKNMNIQLNIINFCQRV